MNGMRHLAYRPAWGRFWTNNWRELLSIFPELGIGTESGLYQSTQIVYAFSFVMLWKILYGTTLMANEDKWPVES